MLPITWKWLNTDISAYTNQFFLLFCLIKKLLCNWWRWRYKITNIFMCTICTFKKLNTTEILWYKTFIGSFSKLLIVGRLLNHFQNLVCELRISQWIGFGVYIIWSLLKNQVQWFLYVINTLTTWKWMWCFTNFSLQNKAHTIMFYCVTQPIQPKWFVSSALHKLNNSTKRTTCNIVHFHALEWMRFVRRH